MPLFQARRTHLLLFVPIVFGDMVFGRESATRINGNSVETRATLNRTLPVTFGGSSTGQFHRWFRNKHAMLCEEERGTIRCGNSLVIRIRWAMYGRTSKWFCRGKNSDKKCRAKLSLQIVKRLCDGRSSCDLFASSLVFGDPCTGTNKYLQVKYRCTSQPNPIVDCKSVTPSFKTDASCQLKRAKENNEKKQVFRLKKQPTSFPKLDLPKRETVLLLLRNPLSRQWVNLYINDTILFNRKLAGFWIFIQKQEFNTMGQYEAMYNWFIKMQSVAPRSSPENKKYFRLHFHKLPFRNLNNFCGWRDDKVFAYQRVAGINPMSLERVTHRGGVGVIWYNDLSKQLNRQFNWVQYIEHALGNRMSFSRAIKNGRVYVLRYPYYEGLICDKPSNVPHLINPHSVIVLFVTISQYQKSRQLMPIAIQLDPGPASTVYTPADGDLWLKAKDIVQITDYTHAEVVEHLLKTHLVMEPICVCVHRHLNVLHPLHQIMKFHCRSIFGTNSVGYSILERPKTGTFEKLLTVGRSGSLKMMERAFKRFSWKDTSFYGSLKRRGVHDRWKLPYFPYRDDGHLIYNAIRQMVTDYVSLYYHSDVEVSSDHELQDFANEISAEGTYGPYGGKGEIKGFPAQIRSRRLLVDTLSRIIWTMTGQHAAVNYPVTYYGAQSPIMPTRMFEDPTVPSGQFTLRSLPNKNTSATQVGLAMTLGSLVYDSLFDYATHPHHLFPDNRARALVTKHYKKLNSVTRKLIMERNRKRYFQGQLTYPYLLPGWIPNSIHT